VAARPFCHGDAGRHGHGERVVDAVHGNGDDLVGRGDERGGDAGGLAAEHHQALLGQLRVPQVRARVLALEHQEGEAVLGRERAQGLVVGQVDQVLVALHAHGRALIERLVPHEEDVLDQEGMGHANDGADVERIAGAQDRDPQRPAEGLEGGLDLVERHVEPRDLHEPAQV